MPLIATVGVVVVCLLIAGGVAWHLSAAKSRPAGPEQTAQAETRTGEAADGYGYFVLAWPEPDAAGASMELDGKPLAIQLGEGKYQCPPGSHRLRILRPGFKPFEVVLQIRPGKGVLLRPAWQPAACIVLDLSREQRQDAVLEVDGKPQDLARLSSFAGPEELLVPVAPGEHRLRINRPGFQPIERTVTLSEGQTVRIALQWHPLVAQDDVRGQKPAEKDEPKSPPESPSGSAGGRPGSGGEGEPAGPPGQQPSPSALSPQQQAAMEALERRRQLESRYVEATAKAEQLAREWDFQKAAAALEKLSFDDQVLQERVQERLAQLKRMQQFKQRLIAAVNRADPPLKKAALGLRGVGGDVTKADEQGFTATVLGGKTESLPWSSITSTGLAKLLAAKQFESIMNPATPDDWVAAALVCLTLGSPSLAEQCLAQARALGVDVAAYSGPLAAGMLSHADELLREGESLLAEGRKVLSEGKPPAAQTRFAAAEKQFKRVEQVLAEIESKYGSTAWFAANKTTVAAARQTVQTCLQEAAAEALYTEAVEYYRQNELHEMKPLVAALIGQYGQTSVVANPDREPSVAKLKELTANLGPRLTVALTGKADFRSIQAAIDAAKGGELIEILDNGPYNEYLTIPEGKTGLTVRGKRGCWPVVTSLVPKPERDRPLLHIEALRTTVQRLVVLKLDMIRGPCVLLSAGPVEMKHTLLYFPPNMDSPIFGQGNQEGGPERRVVSHSIVLGHHYNHAPMTFLNCIFTREMELNFPGHLRECTMLAPVRITFRGDWVIHVIKDCIVRDISVYTNVPPNNYKIENCAFFGAAKPPEGSNNCFLTNPMFRDPANLDYRLMPGSPCIGKASDGGDLGCRYTPEMLELIKVALELRQRGLIKF